MGCAWFPYFHSLLSWHYVPHKLSIPRENAEGGRVRTRGTTPACTSGSRRRKECCRKTWILPKCQPRHPLPTRYAIFGAIKATLQALVVCTSTLIDSAPITFRRKEITCILWLFASCTNSHPCENRFATEGARRSLEKPLSILEGESAVPVVARTSRA